MKYEEMKRMEELINVLELIEFPQGIRVIKMKEEETNVKNDNKDNKDNNSNNYNKKKDEEMIKKYFKNGMRIVVNSKDFHKFIYISFVGGFYISNETIEIVNRHLKHIENVFKFDMAFKNTSIIEFHFELKNDEVFFADIYTNYLSNQDALKEYNNFNHPFVNFQNIYTFDFLMERILNNDKLDMDVEIFNSIFNKVFKVLGTNTKETAFFEHKVNNETYYVLYPKKQHKKTMENETILLKYPSYDDMRKLNELLKNNGFPTCNLRTFVFKSEKYPTIETFGVIFSS